MARTDAEKLFNMCHINRGAFVVVRLVSSLSFRIFTCIFTLRYLRYPRIRNSKKLLVTRRVHSPVDCLCYRHYNLKQFSLKPTKIQTKSVQNNLYIFFTKSPNNNICISHMFSVTSRDNQNCPIRYLPEVNKVFTGSK